MPRKAKGAAPATKATKSKPPKKTPAKAAPKKRQRIGKDGITRVGADRSTGKHAKLAAPGLVERVEPVGPGAPKYELTAEAVEKLVDLLVTGSTLTTALASLGIDGGVLYRRRKENKALDTEISDALEYGTEIMSDQLADLSATDRDSAAGVQAKRACVETRAKLLNWKKYGQRNVQLSGDPDKPPLLGVVVVPAKEPSTHTRTLVSMPATAQKAPIEAEARMILPTKGKSDVSGSLVE